MKRFTMRNLLSALLLLGGVCLISGCLQSDAATRPAEESMTDTVATPEAATVLKTSSDKPDSSQTRKFRFFYDVTITDLPAGKKARVWFPLPQTNHDQMIEMVEIKTPQQGIRTAKASHGNKVVYFEAEPDAQGRLPILAEYVVTRREVLRGAGEPAKEVLPSFLGSSKLVPVDGSLTAEVFGNDLPNAQGEVLARQLYDAVYAHMQYGKPEDKPWGHGDAVYACDAKIGNCTDFHSLFIALSRDAQVPAKFEIGFPLPADKSGGAIGGYHCWAKIKNDGRWMAVDISEADKHPEMNEYYFGNLTPDRVTLTIGRDLVLEPAPAAGPVNYLVYPYVEVDGKSHKGIEKNFRFEDE